MQQFLIPTDPVAHQENIFVWVLIGRNEEAASDNHLMSRLCGDIWIINQDLGPGRGGSNNIYLGEDSMTNMARLRKWPAHTGHSGPWWPSRSWAGLSRYKLKQSGSAGGETPSHVGAWLTPSPRQQIQSSGCFDEAAPALHGSKSLLINTAMMWSNMLPEPAA